SRKAEPPLRLLSVSVGRRPRYSLKLSVESVSCGWAMNRASTSLGRSPASASARRLACAARSMASKPGALPMPKVAAPTMAVLPRGNPCMARPSGRLEDDERRVVLDHDARPHRHADAHLGRRDA